MKLALAGAAVLALVATHPASADDSGEDVAAVTPAKKQP